MSKPSTIIQLPRWLQEAIAEGEPTDGIPNKRGEKRILSALYCLIEQDAAAEHLSARVYNVSANGLGMITRRRMSPGQQIQLMPGDGSDGAPVTARVVHCTQTIQGYKVGCTFVSSSPGA